MGEAIMQFASGDRVRRLTLLQQRNKSPTSGPTKQIITNSGKYGITSGSYAAEYLELSERGRIVVDSSRVNQERKRASFELAIEGVALFKVLYEHYKDKRLPEREIMKDVIRDSGIDVPDLDECVDTFTVNVKDSDMVRTIGGAETLVSIEQVVEELGRHGGSEGTTQRGLPQAAKAPQIVKKLNDSQGKAADWDKCAST
ncbi:hypothetical protein Xazr_16830 [Xanthomonas campestris pv. azadirachtae]|nr:hypothetical protein Xazr_16830 [Xanthomonas campestris pv. azadirachtae]